MGVDYEMTLPVLCENPGPNVHRPLFEPPDHEKVSMAAKMTAKAERTPTAVFSQFHRPAKQGNEYPGIIFGNNK